MVVFPHEERLEAFIRNYTSIYIPGHSPSHIGIHFNCWGKPIKLQEGDQWKAKWLVLYPGAAWAFNKYVAVTATGESPINGGWEDVRTLDQLKWGCCPEIINNIMLGEEGTPG